MKDLGLNWFIEGIRDQLISLEGREKAEQEEGLRVIASRIAHALNEPRADDAKSFTKILPTLPLVF